MLKILLSPAKSIDTNVPCFSEPSVPEFESDAEFLVNRLKKMSPKALSALMSISDDLAQMNWSRFQDWKRLTDNSKAIQPVFSFTGEVYRGFDASSLSSDHINHAQDTIRVLSGLYGILKPLDGICPYRLEMGSKFPALKNQKNLYEFWGDRLTMNLENDLNSDDVIINLASKEYSKAIKFKNISNQVIVPVFKDYKNGQLKTIMMFAKKARGSMARYIVQQKLESAEGIKNYNIDSYGFDEKLSNENEWVFIR